MTIDAAGRIVVPKALRDATHLIPGTPLEVRFRDGRIEIEPAALLVTIEIRGGVAVAVPVEPVPSLTTEMVAETMHVLRERE